MAIFKSRTDPNAAYTPTPALIEAANGLTSALDARQQVDRAIAQTATDRMAADEARKAADAAVEQADLALALELDDDKIAALERQLTAYRMTASSAAMAFDRATKRQTALNSLAPERDAAVATAKQNFQTALATFGREVNESLAAEALEAAQPLIAVLRRAHATAAALNTLSVRDGFLGALVPSPAPGRESIIGNGRADAASGIREDLAATWRDDPAAAGLAAALQPIVDLRRRVAGHAAFVPPPPAAKPYEVQNRRTAEEIAAERAADAAWKPAPSTWNGHVHRPSNGSAPPGSNRGAEVNVVAGIANRAAAELGGAA